MRARGGWLVIGGALGSCVCVGCGGGQGPGFDLDSGEWEWVPPVDLGDGAGPAPLTPERSVPSRPPTPAPRPRSLSPVSDGACAVPAGAATVDVLLRVAVNQSSALLCFGAFPAGAAGPLSLVCDLWPAP